MQFWPIGATKTALAGAVGAIGAAAVQAASDVGHIDVAGITAGVAVGCSVLLLGLFIKQGNRLASIDAREEERNANVQRDVAQLDAESRTVDQRIAASRHAVRNQVPPLLSPMEERLTSRLEEAQRAITALEARATAALEAQINKAKR